MSNWQSAVSSSGIHYYRSGGDKPPLVLAHGYTDCALCWTRTARHFEADYDIVMPDARGHGQSPNPPGDYSSEDHAADIAALIQELGLGKPPVIGHSMGAMNAAFLAANHPECVSVVVLVDPPMRSDESLRSAAFWQDWKARMMADQARSDDDLLAKIKADNPGWHPLEAEGKARAIRDFDMRTFDIYTLSRRHWRDLLADIGCPALLLYADTGIITAEVAAEAESLAPMLVAQRIADAGHSIQRDQFAPFVSAVTEYLRHLAWD